MGGMQLDGPTKWVKVLLFLPLWFTLMLNAHWREHEGEFTIHVKVLNGGSRNSTMASIGLFECLIIWYRSIGNKACHMWSIESGESGDNTIDYPRGIHVSWKKPVKVFNFGGSRTWVLASSNFIIQVSLCLPMLIFRFLHTIHELAIYINKMMGWWHIFMF